MAFVTIDTSQINVGDPITKELLDKIKNNEDDHESRINQLETSGGSIFILNEAFCLAGIDSGSTDIFYYKATQDMSISDFRVQIFAKGSVSSGTLSFDLEKATNTNNANFNSILDSDLSFNFASDADYLEKTADISSSNDVDAGEVIRIKVTSTPTNFGGKVLIVIGAE